MNAKRMTAHYPGRCSVCRKRFPAGAPILWSKSTKAMHPECAEGDDQGKGEGNEGQSQKEIQKSEAKPKPKKIEGKGNSTLPTPIVEGKESYFTIDWPELREHLKDAAFNGDCAVATRKSNRDRIIGWNKGSASGWQGFTGGQIRDWLSNGYESEAIQGLADFTPPLRDKRHYIYAEEGEEIFVDRVLSGEDNYMGEWTKRERIPGIALEAEIMFSAGVDASVVNAYNAWICKAVYALESAGIDCQVTLKFSSDALCKRGEDTHTIVRVKKENEQSDFWNFSPMLSPAALRAFGFSAMALHADRRGVDADSGMGRGNLKSQKWDVVWDEERRVLKIQCPYMGGGWDRKFPEEHMSTLLRDALTKMKTQG